MGMRVVLMILVMGVWVMLELGMGVWVGVC